MKVECKKSKKKRKEYEGVTRPLNNDVLWHLKACYVPYSIPHPSILLTNADSCTHHFRKGLQPTLLRTQTSICCTCTKKVVVSIAHMSSSGNILNVVLANYEVEFFSPFFLSEDWNTGQVCHCHMPNSSPTICTQALEHLKWRGKLALHSYWPANPLYCTPALAPPRWLLMQLSRFQPVSIDCSLRTRLDVGCLLCRRAHTLREYPYAIMPVGEDVNVITLFLEEREKLRSEHSVRCRVLLEKLVRKWSSLDQSSS